MLTAVITEDLFSKTFTAFIKVLCFRKNISLKLLILCMDDDHAEFHNIKTAILFNFSRGPFNSYMFLYRCTDTKFLDQ